MNRSALIFLPVLLAGCDVHAHKGSDENVTINADSSGHLAFNLPFMKGQVKVPAGMMHHGDFDIDGVKLPRGSQLTGFSVFARDKGSTVDMAFTAPAAPDAVRSYFVDQFKQKGVAAEISGDAVSGKSKDGNPFVIHVSPAPNGSTGKIELQSED